MRTGVFVTAISIIFMVAIGTFADIPSQINYQGTLTDSAGNPITGTQLMVFTIYDQEIGGSLLWAETHSSVEVTDGLFHVVLGIVTPVPRSIFTGVILWLETTVEGETLEPRTKLVTVPYGFKSETADQAAWADSAMHAAYSDTATWALSSEAITRVDTADYALQAETAATADHAATSDTADYAHEAGNAAMAVDASHATYSDTATWALGTEAITRVDTADYALLAESATTADHAVTSDTADYAHEAGNAATADYALQVGIADHAATSDTADYAHEAGNAATATEADHAVLSDTATWALGTEAVTRVDTADYALQYPKTNVQTLDNALEKVERLRGVSFEWNQEAESAGAKAGDKQIGVLASEVEQVYPELVSSPEDGYKSVDYTKLTAVLIEAIKELRAENQDLKKRIETLEKSLN